MRALKFTELILPEKGAADLAALNGFDVVYLTGRVYTARDAAHARFTALIRDNKPLPIDPYCIYYAGPSPARPGEIIGSCGPTSSIRMEAHAPLLIENGCRIIIGKGEIGSNTKAALKKAGGVYLLATGGAAALIQDYVTACRVVAFSELGCEAVHEIVFEKLPLLIARF